jgi:hypothetical protein
VGSAEVEGDVFADDQAAVAVDDEAGDEAVDRELAPRLRGGDRRGR